LGNSCFVHFCLLFLDLRISGFSAFSRISRSAWFSGFSPLSRNSCSGWFLFCLVSRFIMDVRRGHQRLACGSRIWLTLGSPLPSPYTVEPSHLIFQPHNTLACNYHPPHTQAHPPHGMSATLIQLCSIVFPKYSSQRRLHNSLTVEWERRSVNPQPWRSTNNSLGLPHAQSLSVCLFL